jgi:hypothetical protein
MSRTILAWHFVGDKLRNDDPVPKDGETLEYKGELILCASGLHASRRIIDALTYAPGDTICRVRCGCEILHDTDKFVCSKRTILWRVDGQGLLRRFACEQALSVAHLWDMPDLVRQYLTTQDESIRAAAWAAARAAGAAWDAAWAAARDAARAAAWAAAWDAASKALTKLVMEAHKNEH